MNNLEKIEVANSFQHGVHGQQYKVFLNWHKGKQF